MMMSIDEPEEHGDYIYHPKNREGWTAYPCDWCGHVISNARQILEVVHFTRCGKTKCMLRVVASGRSWPPPLRVVNNHP